jgi:acyl-CoA synthetase (NDP forming)
VLKLLSRTITHKSDVGGVALNLTEAAAVCAAFDSNFRCAASGKALSRLCGQTLMRIPSMRPMPLPVRTRIMAKTRMGDADDP